MSGAPPLIVDLDGTLIHTDMLHETALRVSRDSPLDVLRIPLWLSQGKAVLKTRLAGRTDFDPAALPYNLPLLDWLKEQRAAGRRLILSTATDRSIADNIAAHLGVFDEVMASDGVTNLAGSNKAAALEARFGAHGFDYAGNSSADLAVWRRARRAIVVNGSTRLTAQATGLCKVEREFPPQPRGLKSWSKVLRVHQWLKNLLLFVPLLAAHQVDSGAQWGTLLLAFISFSLCASTVYIANDLLDLESDRQHPRKRLRPFASGAVPAWMGVLLAPVLLAVSVILAWRVGGSFLPWLSVYFLVTCVYSWGLKRVMLVDCVTLAVLYTLRIIAGAAAIGQMLSFWLLAFSVFLFLSLAFVKRYAELHGQELGGKTKVQGRGYYTSDAPLIQTMGVTSGYSAAVVLALYLSSDVVVMLYRQPEIVWGAVPVLLFWISWIWMQAHRGNMHDDPVVFAIKDRASLLAGLVFGLIIVAGAMGWPWL
ncbi:UbiA family prenyltransferase [Duganella sp. FT27W]|uniref:UbiA family prenyltransferase n=1 Tax=Duganella sp. FT27W TaxID=2654636 RepID=UPI00128BD66D|nr:UbiA family prenyltransferase [Duganella sp. FT27W]MPQ57277.1 UbiA family prenyltransferase [Duganella sp. FT27W]